MSVYCRLSCRWRDHNTFYEDTKKPILLRCISIQQESYPRIPQCTFESQLFGKLAKGPIKGKGKYLHGKLKNGKNTLK